MKKKDTKMLDGLLREVVLYRDKKCQKCGRKAGRITTSHIYPKGIYPWMRYDIQNATMLCFRCHLHWWHKDIILANKWYEETFSEERKEYLKKRSENKVPTSQDVEGIEKYLKGELNKLIKENENN